MGDNPQALARGLSPCTGGPNTMGLLLHIFCRILEARKKMMQSITQSININYTTK